MSGDGGGSGWHTGSLDPGTGGVRDTYKPNLGSVASQSQHSADIEREELAEQQEELAAKEGRPGLVARVRRSVRRLFQGG